MSSIQGAKRAVVAAIAVEVEEVEVEDEEVEEEQTMVVEGDPAVVEVVEGQVMVVEGEVKIEISHHPRAVRRCTPAHNWTRNFSKTFVTLESTSPSMRTSR